METLKPPDRGRVVLARKLLVALWRFARQGIVPEGAVLGTV